MHRDGRHRLSSGCRAVGPADRAGRSRGTARHGHGGHGHGACARREGRHPGPPRCRPRRAQDRVARPGHRVGRTGTRGCGRRSTSSRRARRAVRVVVVRGRERTGLRQQQRLHQVPRRHRELECGPVELGHGARARAHLPVPGLGRAHVFRRVRLDVRQRPGVPRQLHGRRPRLPRLGGVQRRSAGVGLGDLGGAVR